MRDYGAKVLFIAAVALINVIASAQIRAQEFPYVAPLAPEFDGRGNLVRESSRPRQNLSSSVQSRFSSQAPVRLEVPSSLNTASTSQGTAPRPVVAPQIPGYRGSNHSAPRPPQQASFPQSPDNRRTMTGPAPLASNSTRQQPGPTTRQDCSQFPMLIANSRSESEMQMIARQYLTCLIQTGWNTDQARQHVISTIESTYRLAR